MESHQKQPIQVSCSIWPWEQFSCRASFPVLVGVRAWLHNYFRRIDLKAVRVRAVWTLGAACVCLVAEALLERSIVERFLVRDGASARATGCSGLASWPGPWLGDYSRPPTCDSILRAP